MITNRPRQGRDATFGGPGLLASLSPVVIKDDQPSEVRVPGLGLEFRTDVD